MKNILVILLAVCTILHAEEGMFPLSEIHRLNLKKLGFEITDKEIYNPNGISLIDASVRVGGCSASFISKEGLIITNHHCVFGAVQQVSTVGNDYISKGFVAQSRENEIPAPGLTARIIKSYRDVSSEVLSGIADSTDPAERTKIIEKNSKGLEREAEKVNGVTASVAEMFAGKTYLLFIYQTIKDVRLVYVPPRSVGEFGGENDNWVWPRHTGDFSFIRAYVGPDGNPADYSPANVPFTPKHHFTVNPRGAEENDRVFILGYPGRTYRHQTSYYLEYERDIRLPFIQQRNEWMIAKMEEVGKNDPEAALALTSRIKSLANTEKNYRGKMKGFKNLPIVENKQKGEEALTAFIAADKQRLKKYGDVLPGIKSVYDEIRLDAHRTNILTNIIGSASLMSIGETLVKLTEEKNKPEKEQSSLYMEKNRPALKQRLMASLKSFNLAIDKLFLSKILADAAQLPEAEKISAVSALGNVEGFIERGFSLTRLSEWSFIDSALTMSADDLKKVNDPLIEFIRSLNEDIEANTAANRRRTGELNRLSGKLVSVKEEWKKKEFIPDANSTIRMTYGRIRGYNPSDATYYSPITSLRGILEKSSEDPSYNTPLRIRELARKKEYGRYKSKSIGNVPVNILYDMDTTGGNSGSPILNAKGELIGVNFDRAFEATINDYAWDESYSRSIGVDIRYVLWNVEKIAQADYLIREIGIQ